MSFTQNQLGLQFPVPSVQGGTGISSYAAGDLIIASALDTLSTLAIGPAGYVLTSVAGIPAWAAIPAAPVSSVFGRTGAVVAATGDYTEAQIAPSFVAVTTATQTLAPNTKYYTTFSGLCVMTLPTTIAAGQFIKIRAGASGNTFKIAQNAGQQVLFGALGGVSQATTVGTGGYLQSTAPNTTIELECVVANTLFMVVNVVNSVNGV